MVAEADETPGLPSVSPLDPLLEALESFIESDTWLAAYRFVRDHLELLSDDVDRVLAQLVEQVRATGDEDEALFLAEHRQLLLRARQSGLDAAFAEKLETPLEHLAIEDHIDRAAEALERYEADGNMAALDEAVAAWEGALNDPNFATMPLASQLAMLNNAAIVFSQRYQANGRPADLDRAVRLWESAVDNTAADAPNYALYLNNLGTGLSDRYLQTGRPDDLERAITAHEAAIAHVHTHSLEWAAYRNNLGTALRDRYVRTGELDDLDRAIVCWRDAVAFTPPDSPDWASYENNLANGLRDCYARTGQVATLDEAIVAHQAAVAQTPAHAPNRAVRLTNLGNGLSDRYARTGQLEDLEQAISAWQEAVDRSPLDSPDRVGYQNNLGVGLRDRYTQTGQLADLEQAIALWRDAIARSPATSPERVTMQINLGNGLRARYARTGQLADLEAAIAAYEAAVACTPDGSPDLAGYQNNLGNGLSERFERTRELDHLQQAIAAHTYAVEHTRPDAPDWAIYRNNLGNGLRSRYALMKQLTDLDEAIAAHEDAIGQTLADSPDWAGYQNNLGVEFRDRYIHTGTPADLERAIAACQAAVDHTAVDSPDRAMYLSNLASGLRERHALARNPADLDAAVAAYEEALATLDRALLDSPVAFVLGQQARWAGLYARTVDALATAARAADALAAAEGSKSRLLAGLVGRGHLPVPSAIPVALAARERALAGQLNTLDTTELASRRTAPLDDERGSSQSAVAQRAAIVAELRVAWDEMAAAGPAAAEYVTARRGDRLPAAVLAGLAAALEPGEALLSLFDTGGRTLLWLWPATAAVPLQLQPHLNSNALTYDYLANYTDEVLNRATHRALGRPLTHRWRALGRELLGPLRPHLTGVRHLIIAPQGVYHQLPLHALWLSDAGDTLLDHCAVSTVPALSLLERLRRRERPPAASGAVLGYTPAKTTTPAGRQERALFLGEAEEVARLLGVAPRLDHEATGAALEAATTSPLRLLHLSCHGAFNAADALASGVALADGLYTAGRFLARPLPVELVTLSACETGISGSLGGDEMAGFSMALLTAGAHSLLLGLWSVDARTTARLLVAFYERLWGARAAGLSKAEALRQTILALRDGWLMPQQPGFDPGDPYYWAPFTLVGDGR